MKRIFELFSTRKHEFLLIIILLIAAAMRFYHYNTVSLSNDELSALNRIRFDNVGDVIMQGTMIGDTHPAGVQVFIYFWVSVFGSSETAVRLPFILAGILSVFLSYLIASQWFNRTTGLFTAATMAVIGYTILYSQFARPYSLGLLFSLSTVYFWNRILFDTGKWISYSGFVFSSALAAYSHYFSQLFVCIVAITGLFFLKKHNWKYYLLAGLAIALLYLPHLKVFLYQYQNGFGNVSWIGKPDSSWFWNYVAYCFNNSWFLGIAVILAVVGSIILHFSKTAFSKKQIIALLWFLLPFFIGYFFSVYKNPVLQYSVLLFAFPFFLIFIFSFFREKLNTLATILLFVLLSAGFVTTAFQNRFYSTQNYAEFKGIAEHIKKWDLQYGDKNITRAINLNAPYYIHYYLDRMGDSAKFVTYKIAEGKDLSDLISVVNSCQTPYFVFATSNAYYLPESKFIILDKYPYIVEEKNYFSNSFVTLMSKDPLHKKSNIFESFNNFEHIEKFWDTDPAMIDSSMAFSGKYCCRLDAKKVYSSCLRMSYADIPVKDSCWICATANVNLTEGATAELVFSLEKPGRANEWYSVRAQDLIQTKDKWGKVYLAHLLGTDLKPDDIIKVYVWNTGKNKVFVDDLKIKIYSYR